MYVNSFFWTNLPNSYTCALVMNTSKNIEFLQLDDKTSVFFNLFLVCWVPSPHTLLLTHNPPAPACYSLDYWDIGCFLWNPGLKSQSLWKQPFLIQLWLAGFVVQSIFFPF